MNIKLLFFPLALIVFVWVLIGYVKPNWDTYNNDKKELQKLEMEKQKIVNGISNIKKALKQFKSLDADGKMMVYNAVPGSINSDNLVAEINKSATQSGIIVLDISTKEKKKKVNRKCIEQKNKQKKGSTADVAVDACGLDALKTVVNMKAVGTYPMIKDFLSKLDTQNRIIIPNKFKLVAAKKDGRDNKEDNNVQLVSLEANFDVVRKKSNTKVVLSEVMDSDVILKSLLDKGLDAKGFSDLQKMTSGEVFRPVEVSGMGKENLFEDTLSVGAEPAVTE